MLQPASNWECGLFVTQLVMTGNNQHTRSDRILISYLLLANARAPRNLAGPQANSIGKRGLLVFFSRYPLEHSPIRLTSNPWVITPHGNGRETEQVNISIGFSLGVIGKPDLNETMVLVIILEVCGKKDP